MTTGNGSRDLEALPFLDFADLGKIEKDLENLLAEHLLDILFEDAALMPIIQERPMQAEADLYALNPKGDLIIFELKRGFAKADAMLQAIRYSAKCRAMIVQYSSNRKSFFWARTIKVPYLNKAIAQNLVDELNIVLGRTVVL